MKAPEIPNDEPQRLAALRATRLLDSPLEHRFERITRLAKRSFDVQIAAVSLVDDDRQWFKSIQGLSVCETSRDVSFCGHAIHEDAVFVVNDALRDERFSDNPLVTDEPNIRFYAGKPVHDPDGYRIGTLCLIDTQPRDFTAQDEMALIDMASMVEDEIRLKVMSNAQGQLLEELDAARMRAAVDPLTRVWNRAAIEDILSRELLRANRRKESIGLLMIDFDHFKRINDTHGHPAGDAVLREGVARILSVMRPQDALGRYGGEEFMAVIAPADLPTLEDVGERLRAIIAKQPMTTESAQIAVSASFGATLSQAEDSASGVISRADMALYAAKHAGRNRVNISTD